MSKIYPCPNDVENDCGFPACAHAMQCERAAKDRLAPTTGWASHTQDDAREVTGIDWSKPSAEPHKLSHSIPGWDEIPEEFQEWGEPIAADWSAREGVNEAEAKWHLEYISNLCEYAVEHKRAALRWLHSLWFVDAGAVTPGEKGQANE